jgi:mono/diheme cytochrome c family protein
MNGSQRDLSAKLQIFLPFVLLSASLMLVGGAVATLPSAEAQASHAAVGDKHAGEQLFQQRCMQCHSTAEGQKILGPSLYHELAKPHPKQTDAAVRHIIQTGKTPTAPGDTIPMPPWGGGAPLTDGQISNIIAYLHTL